MKRVRGGVQPIARSSDTHESPGPTATSRQAIIKPET